MKRRDLLKLFVAAPILPYIPDTVPVKLSEGYSYMRWRHDIESAGLYSCHIQSMKISQDLTRAELYELGHLGPYTRYVNFPVNYNA